MVWFDLVGFLLLLFINLINIQLIKYDGTNVQNRPAICKYINNMIECFILYCLHEHGDEDGSRGKSIDHLMLFRKIKYDDHILFERHTPHAHTQKPIPVDLIQFSLFPICATTEFILTFRQFFFFYSNIDVFSIPLYSSNIYHGCMAIFNVNIQSWGSIDLKSITFIAKKCKFLPFI